MFLQRPPTDEDIAHLPLEFAHASEQWREVFTDSLLSIWVELAESGSLATLPPVPDIVGFANDCVTFFLIYHTNPEVLKHPPGAEPDVFACSPRASSSSPKRGDKRWHPYPRPSSSSSYPALDEDAQADSFGEHGTYDDSGLKNASNRHIIGCVYLSLSSATESSVDVGIALRPDARGRGYGRAALTKVMRYAFETLRMHRVVANVFGPCLGRGAAVSKAAAKECGSVCWIFEKLGFIPEGVGRRAGFSATDGTWQDVHVLAILDTDWVLLEGRSAGRGSIQTPWDTMMERHEKERDLMMGWMEDPSWGRLKRTGSMETVRGAADPEPNPESEPEPEPKPETNHTHYEFPGQRGSAGGSLAGTPGRSQRRSTPSNNFTFSEIESSDENATFESQAASPAPPSSVGVSPPASVVSLPSDFEWRSIDQSLSSQPSVASASSRHSWQELSPQAPAHQARVTSPPIFSLDSGDEHTSFWESDLDSELEDEGLGAGLRRRHGNHPDI